jgi:molybdenum cofactor cytidylyltransferase
VEQILVITGAGHEQIEELVGLSAQTVHNPAYAQGEMLSSIQAGLQAIAGQSDAAMIALGDQPQIQAGTIRGLLEAYRQDEASIIVPSHENHRGHPWMVGAEHWEEIIKMRPPETMRDFFRSHSAEIRYIEVGNASVLADLDTPEDYLKYHS